MKRRNFLSSAFFACVSTGATAAATEAGAQARADRGIPFYLFDSFTRTAFSGNPAPVLVLEEWLSDSQMQALATEMNQSEVAFVLKKGADWHIRWFTPVQEVPLNGHATLAAAALILNDLEPDLPSVAFHTRTKGILSVVKSGDSFLMDFPADDPPVARSVPVGIEADLGVKPAEFWANNRNILVYRDAEEVKAVRSKLSRETAWAEGRNVIITAPGTDGTDYVLRYFAPLLNIPEDPVTGVVHCTLAPFWANRLKKTAFQVKQLSARRGDVTTGVAANGRVVIGGPAKKYMSGQLFISG